MTTSVAARRAARALPPWPADRPLRSWQERALATVARFEGRSFLASAAPAAGKTTFGLKLAHEMLSCGQVARVVVVAPTTHICRQWALDAARYGIDIEPNRPNSARREPRDRHGVAITYQTVAAGPGTHGAACAARPTLLIADEPHHMGEQAAWGTRAQAAFEGATFRLLLSGTPFRSDSTAIPWVTYDEDGVSRADFTYGYTDALLDGVCRPITFQLYDGDMEWVSGGRKRHADFSMVLPRDEAARRLRTALDPDGDWLGEVLRDADARLSAVRAARHPEAGGLVVAADKEHAARIAMRLARISGEAPEIVTSDEPDSSARISAFSGSSRRWLVSVLMVSEGVDIPRLRVGVYATAARTELFFRQVIGRFVRRTPVPRAQMSYLFLAADPRLRELAARVEEERNHALELRPELEEEHEALERVVGEGAMFEALSSSARADDVITSSMRPGDELQLFYDAAPVKAVPAPAPPPPAPPCISVRPSGPEPAYARRERLRAERNRLVSDISRRTGEPHRQIHGRMNRATGAASVANATIAQLEKANELLVRELRRG
ncbi:MAG TPA: DEAD/DEAH box helicase family protein [Thermoleophilaceae bacterium]